MIDGGDRVSTVEIPDFLLTGLNIESLLSKNYHQMGLSKAFRVR